MNPYIKDANLLKTVALPSAAGSVQTAGIDLGTSSVKPDAFEALLTIPALNTTMVPDTRTVTAVIETSTASNFGTIARTILSVTLTGAGGTGVAAQTLRAGIPSDCEQYIRAKITTGASTGDASSITAELALVF